MAKKHSSTVRKAVVDTGIYQTKRYSGGPDTASMRAVFGMAKKRFDQTSDLDSTLERVEKLAGRLRASRANGIVKRDANEVQARVVELRRALQKYTGKYECVVHVGFELGRAYEKMCVRFSEHHALRGKKVLSGSKQGHAMVHGDQEAKKARWQEYKNAFDEVYKPQVMTKTTAYKKTAAQFGVNPETVARAVRRLSKK